MTFLLSFFFKVRTSPVSIPPLAYSFLPVHLPLRTTVVLSKGIGYVPCPYPFISWELLLRPHEAGLLSYCSFCVSSGFSSSFDFETVLLLMAYCLTCFQQLDQYRYHLAVWFCLQALCVQSGTLSSVLNFYLPTEKISSLFPSPLIKEILSPSSYTLAQTSGAWLVGFFSTNELFFQLSNKFLISNLHITDKLIFF